jgi:hypothetical protein
VNDVVIAILCYVNRSGSTLLSRMISDLCEDVYVFPEVGFAVDLFLARKFNREISGSRLHRLIADDPRTSAMGIPDDVLEAICLRHSSHNPAMLFVDLATARLGRRPSGIVIKHEKLAFLLESIEAAIPQVRYLHIVRDPRAVANSMLKTPVPEKPGFNMARGSILYPARHWRQYVRIMNHWSTFHDVVEVRYEDLRKDNGRSACAGITAVLGARLRSLDGGLHVPTYQVATIDHALHTKIHDKFDDRRTSGWRKELSSRQIRLVEKTCHQAMKTFDYPATTDRLPQVSMVVASLIYTGAMVHHVTRSIVRHVRRGGGIRAVRAQAALLRSKKSQFTAKGLKG